MLPNQFEKAMDVATRIHKDQVRKGSSIPYMAHIMGVASLAMANRGCHSEVIAAILHDTVEDSDGEYTLDHVEKDFGYPVRKLVSDLSDATTFPKPPWKERKMAYIKHLESASVESSFVSLCDKSHNLTSTYQDFLEVGEAVYERFNASAEETLWYYLELYKVFKNKGDDRTWFLLKEYRRILYFLITKYNESNEFPYDHQELKD